MDIKLTILGETGSGKTCYLLGMYYDMSAGRDGYSIVAPDRDESRLLVTRFETLKNASLGRARFPETTDASQKYKFELQRAFRTILPFEWIDYPGGWLDASKSAGSELREVENSIFNSSALFICIDGENLCGKNIDDKIARVRDKSSRHISPYLGRMGNNKKFPPTALIITKFDLCSRIREDEICEVLQKSFSPLFERNDSFVAIIPVSLGKNLRDDDFRGVFKPANMHLPIYMGIWFALGDYINNITGQIQMLRKNISDYESLIRDEESSFFLWRSDDNIRLWRRRKSECASEIQQLQNLFNAMKENRDRLENELRLINLVYANGNWVKQSS